MITLQDAKEILYQIKHHTGIRYNEPENDLAHCLVEISKICNVSKDEMIEIYIIAIHNLSRLQHFNWN